VINIDVIVVSDLYVQI